MPNPAARCTIRFFGVGPYRPKATMCEARADAPALVPARTTPRSCALEIASPSRVPPTTWVKRDWLPPVRNTRSLLQERDRVGIVGLGPLLRAEATHAADAETGKSSRYAAVAASPNEEAVEMTTTWPASARELREGPEDDLVAEAVFGAADHHHGAGSAHGPKGTRVRHEGQCIRRTLAPRQVSAVCARSARYPRAP